MEVGAESLVFLGQKLRPLLFLALFSILVAGLLHYVVPRILYPLRIDDVPGDAYIVPWMRPNLSIAELSLHPQYVGGPVPFNIHSVMAGALTFNITFNIEIPNGEVRIVPSTIYLGHDLEYLYIGGEFIGMGLNPYKDPDTPSLILPNFLEILFDVANDGTLTFPESGSAISVCVFQDGGWMCFYHDLLWCYSRSEKSMAWGVDDGYCFPNAPPPRAIGQMTAAYDNSTGTLIAFFSRHLRWPKNADINALQIRPGERWVMRFLLRLGYATYTIYGMYDDTWPQKGYSNFSNDTSQWGKLCIDLTNPPPQFKD